MMTGPVLIPSWKVFKLARVNRWRASRWWNKILDWEWRIK